MDVPAHDLPADAYPFTITFYDEAGQRLWQTVIEEPGVLTIPGFDGKVGLVRMAFADGESLDMREWAP